MLHLQLLFLLKKVLQHRSGHRRRPSLHEQQVCKKLYQNVLLDVYMGTWLNLKYTCWTTANRLLPMNNQQWKVICFECCSFFVFNILLSPELQEQIEYSVEDKWHMDVFYFCSIRYSLGRELHILKLHTDPLLQDIIFLNSMEQRFC